MWETDIEVRSTRSETNEEIKEGERDGFGGGKRGSDKGEMKME